VPYGLVVGLRNWLLDRGWKAVRGVTVPVISVGNITTGGTGKTPVVALGVGMLQAAGHQPAILSRGYRADASGANDEKRVLDQLCRGVPHVQQADRLQGARRLLHE